MRISQALLNRKRANSWGDEVTQEDAQSWLAASNSFYEWIKSGVSEGENLEKFIDRNHNDEMLVSLYDEFVKDRREYLKDIKLAVPYNSFVEASKDAAAAFFKYGQNGGGGNGGGAPGNGGAPAVDTGALAFPSPGWVKNKDIPDPRKKRKKKRKKEESMEKESQNDELYLEEQMGEDINLQRFPSLLHILGSITDNLGGLKELFGMVIESSARYPELAETFKRAGLDVSKYFDIVTNLDDAVTRSQDEFSKMLTEGIKKRSFLDRIAQYNAGEDILDYLIQMEEMKDKLYMISNNFRGLDFLDPMAEQVAAKMEGHITKVAQAVEQVMSQLSYLQELEETE